MNTITDNPVSDIEQRLQVKASSVASVAEKLLLTLVKLPDYEDERRGGYLSITAELAGENLFCCRIGSIPHADDANPKYRTKARRYLHCSQENATRLITNAYKDRHISSWQSRDEKNDEYGGAVWCKAFAVSFSGLPELADEALCLVLSIHFDWIEITRAKEIVKLSGNPYLDELLIAWREAGHAVPIPIAKKD